MEILKSSALLFLTLFAFSVNAQITIPEKGSTWVYDYQNVGACGPLVATYKKDTVLKGKTAMVLDETLYNKCTNPPQDKPVPMSFDGNIIVIEDSVVWYWNYDKFDTLYDFGAEVGDKWNYYFYFSGEDTLVSRVLEKGKHSDLGAYLILEYEKQSKKEDTTIFHKDTVYEATLGGSSYIIPWDGTTAALDGHRGGPLLCYSNSKGRYSNKTWTTGGAACTDIIDKLSVGEVSKSKIFRVYPNPSNGTIRTSGALQPQRMEVFTIAGQQVYSSASVFVVDNLLPQIYFMKLWRNDGKVEVHRVLVR